MAEQLIWTDWILSKCISHVWIPSGSKLNFFFFFSIGILELICWHLTRLKRKSGLSHRGVTLLGSVHSTVSIHPFPYCLLKDSPLGLSHPEGWTGHDANTPPPAPWMPMVHPEHGALPGQDSRRECRGTCTLVWDSWQLSTCLQCSGVPGQSP